MPFGSTSSSAKIIVVIPSTSPSIGRSATRFSFWRMTTFPIATLPSSRMASSSSL